VPMLPIAGTLTYNGFTFPAYSQMRLASALVLDTARRSVLCVRYTLTVDSYLTAGPGEFVDALAGDARKRLNSRGGRLEIKDKGWGHFLVNDPGGQGLRDVAMGPVGEIAEARPIGARNAWLFTWVCTFNIPECLEGTAVTAGRPMEFTYTWQVAQDEHGFSTRTVAGQLVIPATVLAGQRNMPDNAERYWTDVLAGIPALPSFTRTVDRRLSEDRRTLNFTVTDTEKPKNAFVEGSTAWEGTQDLTTDLLGGGGFIKWTSSIRATYQVGRDRPKKEAYERFLALCASRLGFAVAPLVTGTWVPLDLSLTDRISSQEVSFALRYFYTAANVANAVAASGMWSTVPSTDWPAWASSVAGTVLAARGGAQLAYDHATDSLIDLCDQPRYQMSNAGGPLSSPEAPSFYSMFTGVPTPERSWIAFECKLVYDGDEGAYSLRTLPLAQIPQPPGQPGDGANMPAAPPPPLEGLPVGGGIGAGGQVHVIPGGQIGQLVRVLPPSPAPQERNLVQRRVAPEGLVRVVGRALRLGYPIVPPTLVGAGGRAATLQRPRYAQGVVANPGVPIVAASWDHEYVLDGRAEQTLPLPPNPVLFPG
jgi:hypothetical protein